MSQELVVDLVLLAVLVGYAAAGFRRGLLVGAASVGGFVLGLLGAGLLLPLLVSDWAPGTTRALVVLGVTLVSGVLVQAVATSLALLLRRHVTWEPARAVDAATGLVGGVLAAAFVIWLVAGAVRAGPFPSLARAVAGSEVVSTLDTVAPARAREAFRGYYAAVSGELFPRVFVAGGPEPVREVPVPEPSVALSGAVAAAAAGVVEVSGVAEACGRSQEGSGFVVGPNRILTNAHVVAGMDVPSIRIGGTGDPLTASVVVFDPVRDLAVLDVPGLTATALPLGPQQVPGADVAVAGFPLDGPYTVVPGRVRDILRATGEDIYGTPGVEREVYSLFATVRPGNSGGPVLDPEGAVVGVVFARSLDDASTGYAVTLAEAAPVLDVALTAQGAVPTGACAAQG